MQVGAANGGIVLAPSIQDCEVADQMWAHYSPTPAAQARISKCLNNNSTNGFGHVSVRAVTGSVVLLPTPLASPERVSGSGRERKTWRVCMRGPGSSLPHPHPHPHPLMSVWDGHECYTPPRTFVVTA